MKHQINADTPEDAVREFLDSIDRVMRTYHPDFSLAQTVRDRQRDAGAWNALNGLRQIWAGMIIEPKNQA